MATSIFGDSLWTFVVVGGFIILGAALAFAMFRNKTSARQDQHTEEATRRMYDAQSREDQTPR